MRGQAGVEDGKVVSDMIVERECALRAQTAQVVRYVYMDL
jgi:hypothetical protein